MADTDDEAAKAAQAEADAKAAAAKKQQEEDDAKNKGPANTGPDPVSLFFLVLVALFAKALFPDLDLSKMLPGLLGVPEGGDDNDRLKAGVKKLQGMLGMQESDQTGEIDPKTIAEIQGKLGLKKTGELDKQTFDAVKGFISSKGDMLKMIGLTPEQVNNVLDKLYHETLEGKPPLPLPGAQQPPPAPEPLPAKPAPHASAPDKPTTEITQISPDEQRWQKEIIALQQGLLALRQPDALGAKLFPALLEQTRELSITPDGTPDADTIKGMKAILRIVGRYNLDNSGEATPEMLAALKDMVATQPELASQLGISQQVVTDVEAHYKPASPTQPEPPAAKVTSAPAVDNPSSPESFWARLKEKVGQVEEKVGQALVLAGSAISSHAEAAPPAQTPPITTKGTGSPLLPPQH